MNRGLLLLLLFLAALRITGIISLTPVPYFDSNLEAPLFLLVLLNY
jgi:hypothetical protein